MEYHAHRMVEIMHCGPGGGGDRRLDEYRPSLILHFLSSSSHLEMFECLFCNQLFFLVPLN